MGTMLYRMPTVNPDSAGLAPIDLLDDEIRLYNEAALLYWLDGSAFDPARGMRCRKTDRFLIPARAALPTQQSLAAYNGKPAVVFGTGVANGDLYDNNQGWLPVDSDFSVVFLGRNGGSADNAFVWGNGQAPAAGSTGTYMQHAANGSFYVQVNGAAAIAATTGYLRPGEQGPTLSIFSFNRTTRVSRFRAQRGAFTAAGTVPIGTDNKNASFHLGAAGAASAGTIDAGDVGAVLILNKAVLDADNAPLLALIESAIGNRFGIPAA